MGEWLVVALVAATRFVTETNPDNGGLTIDLLDMQWWQALIGIIAAAGLSPAPWILGLATGRIQFSAVANAARDRELAAQNAYHETIVGEKDARYAELEQTNRNNVAALEAQKVRADVATDAVFQASEVTKMAVHVIEELREAGEKGATPDGS